MLHQQGHLQQLVHLLRDPHVLHRFGDLFGGFGRQPLVGVPGVGQPYLHTRLLRDSHQVPAQELLHHFLGLELILSKHPQYSGEVGDGLRSVVDA